MDRRVEFHNKLCDILGSKNVFFQPPALPGLCYPAIIYSRSNMMPEYADNRVYLNTVAYQVIVIDPNPDSEIVQKIAALPLSKFSRHYTADNLNHDVFIIYY